MSKPLPLRYVIYDTPAGDVTIVSDEKRIKAMIFGVVDPPGYINDENVILYDAIVEINQYFWKQRKVFDLPLAPECDDFSKKIYLYLLSIPFGETRTYQEVAEAVGEKDNVDKVGKIIDSNPIALFIPSHRVIFDKENLGDFVADPEIKKLMLTLEGVFEEEAEVVE
ncbi:MAG: methylated-DNA--[protein]-cysteine S-methyltransferase [Bacilli bacterium]|nr:methylated-DNA--[protein]-cysteine S-methyltransferase [Bacilli bacterium]